MGVNNNNNNIYNFLFRDTCINGGTCIKQVEICFFYFHTFFRSSYQRCFVKKGVLRKFAKFTGKHLCQKVFFNKVAGLPESLFRQRVSDTGVLREFCKISGNAFLREHLLTTASVSFDNSISHERTSLP